MSGARSIRAGTLALVIAALLGGCTGEEPGLRLPAEADLAGLYGEGPSVTLNGNVVDVQVYQASDQLRRGGATWAKVGPYIYLFSPQTQKMLEDWSGVGGVRVTTVDGRGRLIAQALLPRGTLNSLTWPKAVNLVAKARLEGTQRPSYILDLIEYGEEITQFEYSPRYVNGEGG